MHTAGVSFTKLDTSSASVEERAALNHSIGKLTVATTTDAANSKIEEQDGEEDAFEEAIKE